MKKKPKHPKHKSGAKPQVPGTRRQQAARLGAIPHYPYPVTLPGLTAAAAADILPGEPPPYPGAPPPDPAPSPLPPDVRPDENTFVKAMRDLAIAAWKLKGIVFKPGTDEPVAALDAKQLADIGFYAERLGTILGTLGVTMQDFTGQPFHAGMPVKVISAKPTPGLAEEVVSQTLTPTLKFNRTGEFYPGNVITLKPEDPEPPPAAQPPPDAPAN
ncbi:MAG: hypothetical protein LBI02_09015 [Opitutaceae bacterium]|jgi:hypothetical protein|nr:hypothetical protein [Opitutaceae bacterium]